MVEYFNRITYFTSNASAITPDTNGAEALVPVKLLTHSLGTNVVTYRIMSPCSDNDATYLVLPYHITSFCIIIKVVCCGHFS